MYNVGDLTANVRKLCITYTYCGHWKHRQFPSVFSFPNGEPPGGYHFWRSEVQHQGIITVFPPLEARAFGPWLHTSFCSLPFSTYSHKWAYLRKELHCSLSGTISGKCSHLCKTFQVKLYSQVLHCGTGTTPLPAASKCSYLLSHCSLVVGSPLYFYKHPNTFSLLSYPPLGGISCFPLPYSVPKNDVICLVG